MTKKTVRAVGRGTLALAAVAIGFVLAYHGAEWAPAPWWRWAIGLVGYSSFAWALGLPSALRIAGIAAGVASLAAAVVIGMITIVLVVVLSILNGVGATTGAVPLEEETEYAIEALQPLGEFFVNLAQLGRHWITDTA